MKDNKKLDITKKKYFRPVVECILKASPNGTFVNQKLLSELNINYTDLEKVIKYLESCKAVEIKHQGIDYIDVANNRTYMLIFPNYHRLLSIYTSFFTFRGWIKRAQDYGFIISIISIIIAIISLILTLN